MVTTTTGLATSFIQFTRTSNATVTDSDGKIKWAGHNLVLNSESLDAASWTKGANTTIVANNAAAPNGTTTADFIRETNNTSSFPVYQNVTTIASVNYTARVFLKANGRNFANVAWLNDQGTDRWTIATFSLTGSGSVTKTGNGAAGTYVTSSITPLSDNWYLCSITGSHAFTTGAIVISTSDSGTPTYGTYADVSYAGNATLGVLAWGAHVFRADIGGMQQNPAMPAGMQSYYPTTPRNFIGFSEDFNSWTKNPGTIIISKAIIAPNGLRAADKIVASSSAGYQGLSQNRVLSASTQTISFYAKAAEYSLVWASDGANGFFYAGFNLATGATIAGAGGSKFVSSAIQPIGDGWYRCSIVVSNVGAGLFISIAGYPAGATLNQFGAQYTGDGVSGIYVWGAQLSDSASLDAYSPVYGAAVTSAAYYAPRLDFDANGSALGLLVEEQRTNLVLNSAALDNASWSLTNATISADVAGATAVAPDGTNTADKLAEDNNTGIHRVFPLNAITVVSGSTYTYSIYAKAVERTRIQLVDNDIQGAIFDLSNGTVSSPGTGVTALPPVAVGNGWYRCSMTRNAGSTAGRLTVYLVDGTGSTSYAGVTGNGVLLWGAQLELGSFATSYIPTIGASTATRTADVASVSTQAFPYSASEGTLVASATVYGIGVGTSSGIVSLTNGTAAENIAMFRTSSVNNIAFEIRDNNSTQATYTVAMGTQPIKSAVAYALNNSNAALNGVAQTTDTTCTMPTVTAMQIGAIYTGGDFPTNGWIRQITYLPRRLSNSELAARTV